LITESEILFIDLISFSPRLEVRLLQSVPRPLDFTGEAGHLPKKDGLPIKKGADQRFSGNFGQVTCLSRQVLFPDLQTIKSPYYYYFTTSLR